MTEHIAYVAVVTENGFSLGIAKRDRPGYWKTDYGTVETMALAEMWAARANEKLGVSRSEAFDIVTSSMAAQNRGEPLYADERL